MSFKRRNKRFLERHFNVLGLLLSEFYEYLSQPEKPSDEMIRETFTECENRWLMYCKKKQLPEQLYHEFNHQVSEAWKHKETA